MGANVGIIDAASNGDHAVVDRYLKEGINVNQTDRFGQTALHVASESNSLETVQCLLEHGADIDTVTNDLMT